MILEAYDAQLFPVMMLSPRGIIGVSVDVIPKARMTPEQAAAVEAEKAKVGPVAVDGNIGEDAPADEETEDKSQEEVAPDEAA